MPGYRAPVLGGKSIAILGGWGLVCGGVFSAFEADAISTLNWQPSVLSGLLQGCLFGIASGLCWMATILTNPVSRNFIRTLLVAALSCFASWLLDSEWMRQVTQLAGIILFQSMLFSWVGVPVWRSSREASSSKQGAGVFQSTPAVANDGELRGRQFMIIDLLVITTAFAILLFVAGRYEVIREAAAQTGGQAPPVGFGVYWSVLVCLWCAVPAVAVCFCLSSMSRELGRSLKWMTGGIVLAGSISLVLTVVELWASGKSVGDVPIIMLSYIAVLIAYGATLYLFGAAGVGQPESRSKDQAADSTGRLDRDAQADCEPTRS